MISYIIPLAVIVVVRFFEEFFDEINRYKRDKKINTEKFEVYNKSTDSFKQKQSSELREGDIIKIFNQRVPADVIILKSK